MYCILLTPYNGFQKIIISQCSLASYYKPRGYKNINIGNKSNALDSESFYLTRMNRIRPPMARYLYFHLSPLKDLNVIYVIHTLSIAKTSSRFKRLADNMTFKHKVSFYGLSFCFLPKFNKYCPILFFNVCSRLFYPLKICD